VCRVTDSTATPPAAATRDRASAPLATAALVFALVIPVLSLLSQVVSTSLLASGDRAGTELAYVAEGIVVFLLAVTAMVLGSIALVRRGHGRARAAAALGIAALSLWQIIVGLVSGALFQAFLF
jgi:hypothetical protein